MMEQEQGQFTSKIINLKLITPKPKMRETHATKEKEKCCTFITSNINSHLTKILLNTERRVEEEGGGERENIYDSSSKGALV